MQKLRTDQVKFTVQIQKYHIRKLLLIFLIFASPNLNRNRCNMPYLFFRCSMNNKHVWAHCHRKWQLPYVTWHCLLGRPKMEVNRQVRSNDFYILKLLSSYRTLAQWASSRIALVKAKGSGIAGFLVRVATLPGKVYTIDQMDLPPRPHGKPLLNLQVIQILQEMSNLIVYKTVTALRVSNHRTICCK
jgi:hypothetical protein